MVVLFRTDFDAAVVGMIVALVKIVLLDFGRIKEKKE